MEPASDGARARPAAALLAPLVLLLSVGVPVGVLAAASPPALPSTPAPSSAVAVPPTGYEPAPTELSGPVTVSAFSLAAGDCLPVAPPADSVTVTVAPCAEAHEAEVFAAFELPGSPQEPYPGDAVTGAMSAQGCEQRFGDYVGLAYGRSAYGFFFVKPDEQTWAALRDRTVVCILTSPPRAQSARGSAT